MRQHVYRIKASTGSSAETSDETKIKFNHSFAGAFHLNAARQKSQLISGWEIHLTNKNNQL